MKTQALVVSSPGAPFQLQDIDVDEQLRDNEVLIQITATGICHTDLNFSKEESMPGLFPAVFGHEGMLARAGTWTSHKHIISRAELLGTSAKPLD
jgi:Zn-dependent alcohol dehydrogenase